MQHRTSAAASPQPLASRNGNARPLTIGEQINPADEDSYWRENFRSRPYIPLGIEYAVYRPAFRFGWESRVRYFDRSWEEAEPRLQRDWRQRHESALPWSRARLAARDAWERVDGR